MFFEGLKKIKILTDKLNIIVGFGVVAKLNAFGSDIAARSNALKSYIFTIVFFKIKNELTT